MDTTIEKPCEPVDLSLRRLRRYIESGDYRGYDPYDALNSPLLNLLGRLGKYPRIAITQFMKRCPVNPRPLLRIPQEHNPKGLGLFLWGYAKLRNCEFDQAPSGMIVCQLKSAAGRLPYCPRCSRIRCTEKSGPS